ncbi:MAG: winged helix DNA-binding domain-containing protein [Bacteroidota bacterium]
MHANEIVQLRLQNQGLIKPAFLQSPDVVSKMVCTQAQFFPGAKWSLGLRMKPGSTNASDAMLEKAVNEGQIARAWSFRGTIHLMAPEDSETLTSLAAPSVLGRLKASRRKLGLDDAALSKIDKLVHQALAHKNFLTREQLLAFLEKQGIAAKGEMLSHLIYRASLMGQICIGPMQGKQYTLALTQDWLPGISQISREKALAEVALRYFTSHGPATLQDFAWWIPLSAADAAAGLKAVKYELIQVNAGNRTLWMHKDAHTKQLSGSQSLGEAQAIFLPAYDEYLFGYKDRSDVVDDAHLKHLNAANGFSPAIIIKGRAAGTWSRVIGKKKLVVSAILFSPADSETHELLQKAAGRYAAFLGLEADLKVAVL